MPRITAPEDLADALVQLAKASLETLHALTPGEADAPSGEVTAFLLKGYKWAVNFSDGPASIRVELNLEQDDESGFPVKIYPPTREPELEG